MGKHEKLSSRERVARRRAALRAQGLRPKQFWVPDIRSPGFAAEAFRQGRIIAASADLADALALAHAIQYWPPDDPD